MLTGKIDVKMYVIHKLPDIIAGYLTANTVF
jgi:hypothetical protein